jgi:hypothetical protein
MSHGHPLNLGAHLHVKHPWLKSPVKKKKWRKQSQSGTGTKTTNFKLYEQS